MGLFSLDEQDDEVILKEARRRGWTVSVPDDDSSDLPIRQGTQDERDDLWDFRLRLEEGTLLDKPFRRVEIDYNEAGEAVGLACSDLPGPIPPPRSA